jgi:hypothetical protein
MIVEPKKKAESVQTKLSFQKKPEVKKAIPPKPEATKKVVEKGIL